MPSAPSPHPALAALGSGRCLVIGEVALSHDGSLGLAHAFVDAIADAGADAVKFQTHIADAESTPAEPFRVAFSKQDATRYDYWVRMAFTEDEWRGLAEHCRERGVLFISSPFSIEAVDLLERVGQPLWKIASGEVSNTRLLDRVLETRRAGAAVDRHEPAGRDRRRGGAGKGKGVPVGVLQCTTAYPCPPERVGLNLVPFYRERYGCWVGLSDHSATIYPGLAGVALGMDVLELHVALSRQMFGPDVVASVTAAELEDLVDRHPLHRADARQPARQGRIGAADGAAAPPVHPQPGGARSRCRRARCCSAHQLAIKKPGTGLRPTAWTRWWAGGCCAAWPPITC